MKELELLPVSRLLPHPDNPRKDLGDLSELTESVRTQGILQNLTVVPADLVPFVQIPDPQQAWYVVIIGHRRLAAATAAGLETVPCVVAGMNRKEQLSTMLCENVQRSELTVYEQAQGFHQLALLGCNVAEISRRSGFSTKTVKHRIEMAKLDQKILKEVSGRQLSMADFAKLEQLKDPAERNKVLRVIGTRDFNQSLEEAKDRQKTAEKLPAVKQWLADHNAIGIGSNEAYSSRYVSGFGEMGRYFGHIVISNVDDKFSQLPSKKDIGGRQLYYMFSNNRYLCLYVKNENAAPRVGEKKTEDEKARDRVMREVRAKIKELSALHYGLRKDFIEGLTVTKANRDKIVAGALMPALYFAHCSGSNKSDTIDKILGYERSYEYHTDKVLAGLDSLQEKDLARAVYAIYNDSAENWFADDMNTSYTIPNYDPSSCNVMLQLLYRWLESLGYEPSTEEQQMIDGTHPLYHVKPKKKGAK